MYVRTLLVTLLALASLSAEETPPYQVIADLATLPILTPALEGRQVEKILLDNGLQVYLISDPGADQSAAAMAVEVGSWHDPQEYPGTAHFLEHMLFAGTKAYPTEFEFMRFAHERSGNINAYTASDRTVYMFSINNDSFEEGLDRFAHFFIDPLLSMHCMSRELIAVDQEHAKNVEHDGWRQLMILREMGNPEHPNSRFSTGNAKTLGTIPEAVLREWYESHYSASKMHLVLISPLPLEEMRTLAVDLFSAVRSLEVAPISFPKQISSPKQRGHMTFIKPVKDMKQLSLSWEVHGPFATDIERQAPTLIAYALQSRGPHSLTQVLKEENIAEHISVSADRLSKDNLLFSIDIDLTEQGLTKVDTAIQRTFEAIARLKSTPFPAYLFDEIQSMARLNYEFQSRDDAFSMAMSIASELPYETLATYPEKTKIPTTFDPDFVHRFLNTLTAEECLYFVLADPAKTKIATDKKERWMGAEYTLKPISRAHMTAWNGAKPTENLQLPAPNPYLPKNLALVPAAKLPSNRPLLLVSDDDCSVYFAQDTRYLVPEVACRLHFKSPLIENRARSQVLTDLYARAFVEKLAPELSLASKAGLTLRFYPDDLNLTLTLSGYSDKAPLLLNQAFGALTQVSPTQEAFEVYKASLTSDYDNASKELPVRQAMQELDALLFNKPTAEEKLKAIQHISHEEFLKFAKELFNQNYTEALFLGNLTLEQTRELWTDLQAQLPNNPYLRESQAKREVLVLKEKSHPSKIVQSTDRQGSGVLLLLQEGPFTFERKAIQQILGYALSDSFFDTLRTKQQTGYIAKAWNTEEEKQLLQFFAVQSSTHTPADLLARFDLFLETFDKNFTHNIPEGHFESLRANLITLLKMPPENMPAQAALLDTLAFEYHDLDWIHKRIESVKALSYDAFCKEGRALLSRSNPRRLAVLMEGVLPQENDFRYRPVAKEEVATLGEFVSVQ